MQCEGGGGVGGKRSSQAPGSPKAGSPGRRREGCGGRVPAERTACAGSGQAWAGPLCNIELPWLHRLQGVLGSSGKGG